MMRANYAWLDDYVRLDTQGPFAAVVVLHALSLRYEADEYFLYSHTFRRAQ